MPNTIQHIFVLMLENRSFDHMLGFSGIKGSDAVSGRTTEIAGLMDLSLRSLAASYGAKAVSALGPDHGRNWPPPPDVSLRSLFTSNQIMATLYSASKPAPFVLNVGPGHEFSDVLLQLCGLDSENAYLAAAQSFRAGGGPAPVYPAITNSGFA